MSQASERALRAELLERTCKCGAHMVDGLEYEWVCPECGRVSYAQPDN